MKLGYARPRGETMTKCTEKGCRATSEIDHRPSNSLFCWTHWVEYCNKKEEKPVKEVPKPKEIPKPEPIIKPVETPVDKEELNEVQKRNEWRDYKEPEAEEEEEDTAVQTKLDFPDKII